METDAEAAERDSQSHQQGILQCGGCRVQDRQCASEIEVLCEGLWLNFSNCKTRVSWLCTDPTPLQPPHVLKVCGGGRV